MKTETLRELAATNKINCRRQGNRWIGEMKSRWFAELKVQYMLDRRITTEQQALAEMLFLKGIFTERVFPVASEYEHIVV